LLPSLLPQIQSIAEFPAMTSAVGQQCSLFVSQLPW
jgi:hypothetical protein